LAKLVFPAFKKAKDVPGLGRGILWTIHFVIVAAILVGLYFLNERLNFRGFIPAHYPFLAKAWLSILFLLIYLLAFVSWWLWSLLAADEEDTEFPDIDRAWEQALDALGKKGIDLTDLPLFLVLGHPEGEEKTLFQAAQLQLVVNQVPHGEAPLH